MYSALFTFNTMTGVPLSKTLNPQLLPGRRSINGCPLLRVCVHGVCVCVFTVCVCVCTLDGLNTEHKFRVWVTILGHVTFTFTFTFNQYCYWSVYWYYLIIMIVNHYKQICTSAIWHQACKHMLMYSTHGACYWWVICLHSADVFDFWSIMSDQY